ncbi:MAG: hypothetical protein EPN99_16085 [Frankiales bacterium]|nr:MAG: hypothetical protein EPN99_16085 [Frankiales bacterium]
MSRAARLGTVGVLLGAVVAAGQLTAGPAPEGPVGQRLPVTARTAVCPDVRQDGDRGASTVTAAGGATRTGGPLVGARAPVAPGPVARDLAAGLDGAVHVTTATGAGAGALVVEQTTRATTGTRRGVAALTCPTPSAESWFVGGATVLGTSSELLLVNGEPTVATVDVTVWSSTGRADPRPGRGIRVPPRTRVAVPLDRLAPDRDLLALRVAATTGRVASALRVVRVDGRTPLGTDWVPPSPGPARESVVPGLPQGPGRRTLLVTNPGDVATTVTAELTTDDGQLVPDDLRAVEVPAGTSLALDLSDALTGTPAAVRVRSDGAPVLAGALVVDRQDGPVREIAFAAATPALDGPSLLADVRLSPPTEVLLLLSTVTGDAVVDLVPTAPGELAAQRVQVPAATTVAVRLSRFLPPGSTGSLGIELRPVSGRVHAARYSRERGSRGPFTTLLPVLPAATSVTVPAVVGIP